MQRAEGRLSVLAGHLASRQSDLKPNIDLQTCAAHNLVLFARPEAPKDCFYANPTCQGPPSSEVEAMAIASGVLRNISALQTQTTALPPSSSLLARASQNATPPLFARVETPSSLPSPSYTQSQPPLLSTSTTTTTPSTLSTTNINPTDNFSSSEQQMTARLTETEFGYVMEVPLPGICSEDVKIELLPGDRVLIAAQKRHHYHHHAVGGGGLFGGRGRHTKTMTQDFLPALYYQLPEVFGLPTGRASNTVRKNEKILWTWTAPKDANVQSIHAELKDGLLIVKVSKKNVLTLF